MLLQKCNDTENQSCVSFEVVHQLSQPVLFTCVYVFRLQELEDQYRKEREEANNLLEQQRLVQ